MIAKELIARLKAHKGPVFLDVNNHNDGFWFQAVKSDLIVQLSAKFGANEESGFVLDANGYFGKDYDAPR